MQSNAVLYEKRGAVGLVTLNRPERLNALSLAMREGMQAVFDEARADDGVRALVLIGAGRGFCAGADLVEAAAARAGPPAEMNQAGKLDEIMWPGRLALMLHGFDKPLIGAINGVAAGGGMGVALAPDIRVGSPQARFKTVFAERALGPDCGVSYALPRLVGYSRAADLLLTCRTVEADEALRIGLLDRLVAHERLLEEAMALAQQIADGPPLAQRIAKRVLQAGASCTLEQAVRQEALGWHTAMKAVNDQAEAARAFLEKRKAAFTGT